MAGLLNLTLQEAGTLKRGLAHEPTHATRCYPISWSNHPVDDAYPGASGEQGFANFTQDTRLRGSEKILRRQNSPGARDSPGKTRRRRDPEKEEELGKNLPRREYF